MSDEKSLLQRALQDKERTQELINNLDRMKASSGITQQRYDLLMAEYQQKMTNVVSQIASIKSQLKINLQNAQERLHITEGNLEDHRLRLNTGELSLKQFRQRENNLLTLIAINRKEISELEMLLSAKTSLSLGTPTYSKHPALPVWGWVTISIASVLVVLTAAFFILGSFKLLPSPVNSFYNSITGSDNATQPLPKAADNTTRPAITDNMTTPAKPTAPVDNVTPAAPPTSPSTPSDNTTPTTESHEIMMTRSKKAVVQVKTTESSGSGALISIKKSNYIITSTYVLNMKKSAIITLGDGRQRIATLISKDDKSAIALLHMEESPSDVLTIPVGDVKELMIKDEVFALTFSTSDNSTLSDISGHISYMDESTIQTDIVFREPTMGATLINKKGKLIGVIQGKIGDTGKCFATPINIINEFIHSKFGESK